VGNPVNPISFDDRVVKESCVPITFDCPLFFCSLDVVGFILFQDTVVLLS
jgi:hypothetical protein